jgi:hypothetical protein
MAPSGAFFLQSQRETFHMDLTSLAVSSEGSVLTLTHPVTGADLPVKITLLGTDSPVFRKAQRAIVNRRLKQAKKTTLTAEEIEAEGVDALVACTVSWEGVELDGKKLDCTPENIRRVYTDVRLPFIREQVDSFIAERANFMKALPENS